MELTLQMLQIHLQPFRGNGWEPKWVYFVQAQQKPMMRVMPILIGSG
jgi:hypothetical protein